MKKKIILFFIIFCVATIITSPNFVPSHGLDSYYNIFLGYEDTAVWFLQKGRLFSALMFWIYSLVNLPFDSMGFLSAFGVNICLSASFLIIYDFLEKKTENNFVKLSILILSFTLFYMPLMIEVIMFDEAMIMGLGILMAVLAAKYISLGGLKCYLLASLFMIISVASYQGMACFLIPILLLFEASKIENNDKSDILNILKKLFIAFVIYGIAFVTDLVFIKIVAGIFGEATSSVGNVNLIKNIYHIFTYLIPTSLKQFFGYISPKIYYLFVMIMFIFGIIGIIQNKSKTINILLLIGVLLSSILMPFVPNIVMNSDENYIAARTILSVAILPSVIGLLMLIKFNVNFKFSIYIICTISLIIMLFYCYLIYKNTRIDLERYRQDTVYLSQLQSEISIYEQKEKVKIKYIYYAYDTDSAYHYDTGYENGANIRVMAEGWALKAAVNDYAKKDYDIVLEQMSEDDYNKYFKNKNYDVFDKKQLHFDGNKLYLLIY